VARAPRRHQTRARWPALAGPLHFCRCEPSDSDMSARVIHSSANCVTIAKASSRMHLRLELTA
jgi:hypothetical protein